MLNIYIKYVIKHIITYGPTIEKFASLQSTMKKALFFITVLCTILLAEAAGVPQVRNFTRINYGGAPQNWDVTQDELGRIYVGNGYSMMAFDGQRWKHYGLPNSTSVRAVMYDKDSGRIYAAGTEEVGYFLPDSVSGILEYHSLMGLFGERPPFTEIWNIFRSNGLIWFQSDYHMIEYDGKNVMMNRFDGRISRTANVGGRIYVALEDGTIHTYDGQRFSRSKLQISGKKITAILPGQIIATADDGLYRENNLHTERINSPISDFLKNNLVFCAAYNRGKYVFGTVNRGVVITDDPEGDNAIYLNKENGLQNNTVLNVSFDRNDNIWLCLDNGLDYAIADSPISNLIGSTYDIGAGYTSMRHGDNMLLGTNQGLYSTPYPFASTASPLAISREINGQIWSISNDFIGGDTGLYVESGKGYSKIPGLGGTFMAHRLPEDDRHALASTYEGFHLLELTNGKWTDAGRLDGYDDIGGKFIMEKNNIWLPHWRKGVYKLTLRDGRIAETKLYDETAGLPSRNNISVMSHDGRPVFSTDSGFYVFDNAAERFISDSKLNELFGTRAYGQVTTFSDGTQILATNHDLIVANGSGIDSISLRSLSDKVIPGYMNLNFISPEELIVSNQDGFWSINTQDIHPMAKVTPYISSIYANRDSLVFLAHGGVNEIKLPYSLNSLRFNFATADYTSPGAVEYSSMLDDYDSDFSPFSSEASREYTRLREGSYTMEVRARDAYGNITLTSFQVRISPPWYRSGGALLLYFIATVVIFFGIGIVIRRRLRQSRRRIEERKNYEIAALKSEQLEQDIKHKSEELSTTTMNLIRKNEILQEIAGEIENLTPGDSATLRRQLDKLQKHISDSIGHDDDQKEFIHNFDIVYQDFTKRLMERHPQLTAADKRMCCYIKMGLSSKEIAPLLNISFKSVEMARYRLRKKMALSAETSLSDYLATI